MTLRVWGLGFRFWGCLGLRVQNLGSRVQGFKFRVECLGSRAGGLASMFKVQLTGVRLVYPTWFMGGSSIYFQSPLNPSPKS